jgi:hypothetical protein
VLWITGSVGALLATGCEDEPRDARPETVVEEFIDRMRRVHGDPKRARSAYELLWSEAKQNLGERAKRGSAVAGRPVGPEEMIAPSYFTTHFEPREYRAEQQGGWAVVTVSGDSPEDRREVRCAREEGRWRVVIDLPKLAPIERRHEAPVGSQP